MKKEIKNQSPDPTTMEGKADIIARFTPPTRKLRNTSLAFIFGALLCASAEALSRLYTYLGAGERTAPVLTSLSFIALSALLTALGVFDRLVRYGGAGLLVPITGFANSVVSVSLDSRSEGRILGTGAKLFTVAGPVIVFGVLASALYGLIYYLYPLIMKI